MYSKYDKMQFLSQVDWDSLNCRPRSFDKEWLFAPKKKVRKIMAPMFVTNRAPLIRRQVRKTLKINVFIVCIRNTIPLFSKINLTVT